MSSTHWSSLSNKLSSEKSPLTPEVMEHIEDLLVKALKEGLQKEMEQDESRKVEMDQEKKAS